MEFKTKQDRSKKLTPNPSYSVGYCKKMIKRAKEEQERWEKCLKEQ